jgi:hypothetical protein
MLRVLKRFLAVFDNQCIMHDVMRMELGCRSLSSWMALRRMPADRLPARCSACSGVGLSGRG